MISLILLGGCSGGARLEEGFNEWKSDFLAKTEHNITVEVTSVAGGAHGEYTLSYHRNGTEETVTVTRPEMIANVKAHFEGEDARLSFDGVMLETGAGLADKLSPLTAAACFMDYLEAGFLKGAWTEEDGDFELIVTEHELSDGSRMTLWQDKADMTPLYAAIRSGSAVEIKIKFTEI